MGLFQKAENNQGYLKACFLGFPGSGKTYTAASLAIGLHKMQKEKKSIYAVDTEKGFDYAVARFEAEKIPLQVARTRAFTDLLAAIDEAEKEASVLIVDSVTHFWAEIQDAYKREHKRTQIRLQDWGPIKGQWNQFPVRFLNSKLHIIVCGRAGDDMDYQENEETGKMEAYKAGIKMMAEKNLAYEPGLVVEMERVNVGQLKRGKRSMVNRAHILKDRFDVLDGQSFDDPNFETFLPHIKALNLGIHAPMSGNTSSEIFDKNSDKNYFEKKKQSEILSQEVLGELTSAFPGTSADEKKLKTDLIYAAFKTRSWTAIEDMPPEKLREGLALLKAEIIRAKTIPPMETKEKVGGI